jgi:two-component system sensor histidine kinase ChvG
MALDSEPTALEAGSRPSLPGLARRLIGRLPPLRRDMPRRVAMALIPSRTVRRAVGDWFGRQPLVRFISASLLRRILVSNLMGLAILLIGILYLSQHHAWLIDAKRDSLKAQGEIIAAAIAANASMDTERIVLDPDKLPEVEGSRAPFRDDGFAALELSIRPERVTPILRRLIQPTNTRARIYGRDGALVVDSNQLLTRGQFRRHENTDEKPRTKNFWTRLTYWFIDKELPVYKEIGAANGKFYPEVGMALSGTTTAMLLLDEKYEQIVSVAVPIHRRNAVQGVLLLSTRPGEIDEILGEERAVILGLAALALLATIFVSLLLARTVAGPMRRLSAAAEQVSRDLTARHNLPSYSDRRDEVGQMAVAFGAMTAALYRRLEASEKFAADVAHELKNPLTAARSTAESLDYAKTDEQRNQLIFQIQSELKRLNRLITDVSNASRLDAELARQHRQPTDLVQVLGNVTGIFRDILSGETRSIKLAVASAPYEGAYTVLGDDGRLAQVLTNLVDNALSFSPEGGTVTVRMRLTHPWVEVAVEDEGPGIPEDRLVKIFDRFYTDRPATEAKRGKNSGLGLSISREIVKSHGGEIWAENRYGEGRSSEGGRPIGARFVVRIPVGPQARGGILGARRA